MNGTGILLEDCFFHNIYRPAIFCTGRMGVIRRCNFYRCGYALGGGQGPASIIEDCMMIQCGQDPHEDIDSRVNNDGEGGGPVSFKGGPRTGGIFRYNIVADSTAGIWWDCGGTGLRIIGNCFWSNRSGSGIYNEWGVNDSLIIGNYFYRTAMSSSWSTRMTVIDNFFDNVRGGGVSWANRDPWPLRHGFMTLRGNAFTGIHMAYIGGENRGQDGLWPDGFATAFVDFNRVRLNPDASVVMHGATTRIKTLGELQKKFGWDLHGEVRKCDPKDNDLTPEAMGGSTVTFRLPWGPRAHLARPMLADAKIDGRWPAVPEYAGGRFPAFFWRVADGDCNECTFNGTYPDMTSDVLWRPDSSNGLRLGRQSRSLLVRRRGRQVRRSQGTHREGAQSGRVQLGQPLAGDGRRQARGDARLRGLLVDALDGCLPGRQDHDFLQDVRQEHRSHRQGHARGLRAVHQRHGPADDPRVHRRQGADGEINHPELTKGTFDWTDVKEVVTAPESAVRMAVVLGILPCKGEVGFDDIEIKTADGPRPAGESGDCRGQADRDSQGANAGDHLPGFVQGGQSRRWPTKWPATAAAAGPTRAGTGHAQAADRRPGDRRRALPHRARSQGGGCRAGQSPARHRRGQGSNDPRGAKDGSIYMSSRPARSSAPNARCASR